MDRTGSDEHVSAPPHYSSNRMVREYVANAYLPASNAYHLRAANGGELAQDIHCGSLDPAMVNVEFYAGR